MNLKSQHTLVGFRRCVASSLHCSARLIEQVELSIRERCLALLFLSAMAVGRWRDAQTVTVVSNLFTVNDGTTGAGAVVSLRVPMRRPTRPDLAVCYFKLE